MISASSLRITALTVDVVATIILTLHVIIIHSKISVSDSGGTDVAVNGREGIERVMLIIAAIMYLISFILFLWAEIRTSHKDTNKFKKLEAHLGIELNNVSEDQSYVPRVNMR